MGDMLDKVLKSFGVTNSEPPSPFPVGKGMVAPPSPSPSAESSSDSTAQQDDENG